MAQRILTNRGSYKNFGGQTTGGSGTASTVTGADDLRSPPRFGQRGYLSRLMSYFQISVVAFDLAFMAAMDWPWPLSVVLSKPGVVASGMSPP